MDWIVDLIIIFVFVIVLVIWIFIQRRRLMRLWTDVTNYEVQFHRQLGKTVKLFYEQLDNLRTEDNKNSLNIVRRYRKKHIRTLLLNVRQDIYNAITIVYDDVLEAEEGTYDKLIEAYDTLQKIRRIYNSKVLIYNQTISVFPTRYIALRMNLELKEYFG